MTSPVIGAHHRRETHTHTGGETERQRERQRERAREREKEMRTTAAAFWLPPCEAAQRRSALLPVYLDRNLHCDHEEDLPRPAPRSPHRVAAFPGLLWHQMAVSTYFYRLLYAIIGYQLYKKNHIAPKKLSILHKYIFYLGLYIFFLIIIFDYFINY